MPDKRLGKGLGALITTHSTEYDERHIEGNVSINQIIPNHNQPRKEFDSHAMGTLTKSIKKNGILQPLTVRELDNGKYELIAGERRFRAAQTAGLNSVPVYILSIEADIEMMEYALIENIQRVDLNPIEEAEAFAMLAGKYDLTNDQIASRIGKNRSTIANSLRLLQLPSEIKLALKKGQISSGHARAILGIKKAYKMISLFQKVLRENLNVRQTESLVKKYSLEKSSIVLKKINTNDYENINIENELKSIFNAKVAINRNKKGKGKIKIEFYNDNHLKQIIKIITESK